MHAMNVYYIRMQGCTVIASQGIVKTLKDSFGFIERADIVKDVRAQPY